MLIELSVCVVCMHICDPQVIREVIEVHSGELARVWQDEMEEEEEAKVSRRPSHRFQPFPLDTFSFLCVNLTMRIPS